METLSEEHKNSKGEHREIERSVVQSSIKILT